MHSTHNAEEHDNPDWDETGKRRSQTRSTDFYDMGTILRDLLEQRWPGAMPEGYQQEIDDLLQDHQYDKKGKRLGPTSSLDGVDLLLSSIYRRNMGAAA